MGKLRVGVLRGGPSSEYEVSLLTGNAVLQNLPEAKYDIKDVLIDKSGNWYLRGQEKAPADILQQIDVALLALHGEFGEDGKVQRLLDQFAVPYTGSGSYASTMSMHKAVTKEMLKDLDVLFARDRILTVDTNIREQLLDVIKIFAFPIIVKPVRGGSSVGLGLAKNAEELGEAVRRAFEVSNQVLIEEYLPGREATCGVVENFRGENVYTLLPVEIISGQDDGLYDYKEKYETHCEKICPAPFSKKINEKLQEIAKEVHKKMNLRHYSRSDFRVNDKGIYFLEVNTLPGLTSESLLPTSISAVGSSLPEFLDHIVTLAKR